MIDKRNLRSLVGNTPLFQLESYQFNNDVKIFAKLESFNPGGSVKDRLGFHLVEEALNKGLIQRGDTIVEPTAGNTAIGLALAAIHYGLRTIFVVPEKFSKEKQTLMKALGAEVVHTPTELGMKGAIEKAKQIAETRERVYYPNQFANEWNPEAYYQGLGPEIYKELAGNIDIFIAGAGTGGTFTGVAKYLKEQNPLIKTVVVEPEGSIINGGQSGSHETEGIGMEFFPPFFDHSLYDDVYTISDQKAFTRVKEIALREGLLVGSSSGAVLEACLLEAEKANAPKNIVTIFPDSSERYLSKNIYGGIEK